MRDDLSDDAIERLPAGRSLDGVVFYNDGTLAMPTWWPRRGWARMLNFNGNPTTAAYRTTHENQRIRRLLRRLNTDGFTCAECGAELPLHRNANTRFCHPRCQRRWWKGKRTSPIVQQGRELIRK